MARAHLLEKARLRGRLGCAGHQLLRDPAYEALTARAATRVCDVVNLLDPAVTTRHALIARLRADGWNGRMPWVPISLLAAGLSTAGDMS